MTRLGRRYRGIIKKMREGSGLLAMGIYLETSRWNLFLRRGPGIFFQDI
jgi:hypothetical protein